MKTVSTTGRARITASWSIRGSRFTNRTTTSAIISRANFRAGRATHAATIFTTGDPGTAQQMAWNQTTATASRGTTHHDGSTPPGSQTSTAVASHNAARAASP